VARSLFAPTTLRRAFDTLGFVQADPIRAPACAQDLTLRHRVAGYRAGDLKLRLPAAREPRADAPAPPGDRPRRAAGAAGSRGVRVYALREGTPPVASAAECRARLDALVDVAVRAYAPLPGPTLRYLVNRLQYGAPQ
jgi:hypothetical protein